MLNELIIRELKHEENKELMDERNSLIKKIHNTYKKLDSEMLKKHEEKVNYFLSTFKWLLMTWKQIEYTSDRINDRADDSKKLYKLLAIATLTLLIVSQVFEFENSTVFFFASILTIFFLVNLYQNMMCNLETSTSMCSFRVTESLLMRDWEALGLSSTLISEARDNQLQIVKLEKFHYSTDTSNKVILDMVAVENSIIKNDIITFQIELNLLESY